MTEARSQLPEMLEGLTVHSWASYSWLGQLLDRRVAGHGLDGSRAALVRHLELRLYLDFYASGGMAPATDPDEHLPAPWPAIDAETALLADAVGAADHVLDGWRLVTGDGGGVVVERDGLGVLAPAAAVRAVDGRTGPGSPLALAMPPHAAGPAEGYFTAYGAAGRPPEEQPTDRVYWNVRPEGRAPLLARVTSALNRRGARFRIKALRGADVARCDAAVLYTAAGERRLVVGALRGLVAGLADDLRPRVPVFALPLAPGVGFAEDPPGDESFGSHRCRLVAEALVGCHAAGVRSTGGRLAAVEARFREAGLDLDAPHRNPGSPAGADPVLT